MSSCLDRTFLCPSRLSYTRISCQYKRYGPSIIANSHCQVPEFSHIPLNSANILMDTLPFFSKVDFDVKICRTMGSSSSKHYACVCQGVGYCRVTYTVVAFSVQLPSLN